MRKRTMKTLSSCALAMTLGLVFSMMVVAFLLAVADYAGY